MLHMSMMHLRCCISFDEQTHWQKFFYPKCAYWSCALKVVETQVLISCRVQLVLIVQYKLRYENSMWYVDIFCLVFLPAIFSIVITIPVVLGWHRILPSQVQARCTCQSSVTVSCQVSSSEIILIDENQTKPEKDFWLSPDFFCPSSSRLAGLQCAPHFCIFIPLCNISQHFTNFTITYVLPMRRPPRSTSVLVDKSILGTKISKFWHIWWYWWWLGCWL